FKRKLFLFFANIFTKLMAIITGYQLSRNPKFKSHRKYRIIGKITSFTSPVKWNYLYSNFISSCKGKKYCFLPSGGHGVYAELFPVDIYFPLSEGVFEGKKVNLPNNYDAYLRNLYGNYMELPPLNKQRG